jgi:type II secretory pathway predicted ATPase ExeA
MNDPYLAPFALKWNPFSPEVPTEALLATTAVEHFIRRIEKTQLREGGFALITGDPGIGKSVVLRLLAERLAELPEVEVGALARPQGNLADFYRELGDLFSVPLRPHNRWAGSKTLRERWQQHFEATLIRPVLLIDEAQEMSPAVLNELRLLCCLPRSSVIREVVSPAVRRRRKGTVDGGTRMMKRVAVCGKYGAALRLGSGVLPYRSRLDKVA